LWWWFRSRYSCHCIPVFSRRIHPREHCSYAVGGCGGGSSRFGPYKDRDLNFNIPTSVYYLIAGGGGGGTDYGNGTTGSERGEGGGLKGGNGGIYFLHPSGEKDTCPGGGGTQHSGGAGGVGGRLSVGGQGKMYQAGISTGAGSGGGYYGGGGSCGYYAHGGGGSGFVGLMVKSGYTTCGGFGIGGHYWMSYNSQHRPSEKTGMGGTNAPAAVGNEGGDGAVVICKL